MPNIGDITHGRDLGKTTKYPGGRKYIYCVCPDCGKNRWLIFRPKTTKGSSRCQQCCGKDTVSAKHLPHGRGEQSPHWKGGKTIHHQGYIICWVSEQDPYYPMATHKRLGGGTIFEHRLVIAQSLGRCLTRQEHVHHKNGIKADNSIENLELISQSNHLLYKQMCSHCDLRKQIRSLQSENERLRKLLPALL